MTIVVILVIAAQVWTKEPSAANWINGIAATLSGMNVALTFFILRAALGQLDVLHQDMNNQEARHREALKAQEQRRVEEAEQARTELARQENDTRTSPCAHRHSLLTHKHSLYYKRTPCRSHRLARCRHSEKQRERA